MKNVWLFVHVLNILCWPVLASFLDLDVQPGQHILDIACNNGLTSRRLAALGANVTAFDFSMNLIERAKTRANPQSLTLAPHPLALGAGASVSLTGRCQGGAHHPGWSVPGSAGVSYHVLDATDEEVLLALGER